MATVGPKKFLDPADPVGFLVRASKQSGLIEVFRNDENLPIIFWKDPEPIPVNYYSFSSWGPVVGKWMFRCKPDPLVKPKMPPDARGYTAIIL